MYEKGRDFIHNDISLFISVIPGLTRNPVFSWIPAFAGMTYLAMIYVAMYRTLDKPLTPADMSHTGIAGKAYD